MFALRFASLHTFNFIQFIFLVFFYGRFIKKYQAVLLVDGQGSVPAVGTVGTVRAPGLLGGGSGGVSGGSELVQMSGPGVLDLRGVHYVLSVVGQLDVSLEQRPDS